MTLDEIISTALEKRILRKIVLSKPVDKNVVRAAAKPFMKGGAYMVQLETQTRDGKARHENMTADKAGELLYGTLMSSFHQMDILTSAGDCVAMRSDAGRFHIKNNIVITEETAETEISEHDRERQYILSGREAFLRELGISDADGNVIDRRRAKFRQINRFLELLRDVVVSLPSDGTLQICDLCCGKSYLTFAVYYYLTQVLGRAVTMTGIDRKPDVIEYCANAAEALGCSGLSFICGDVAEYAPAQRPDLVISLHACDIATDIVLWKAISCGARVILSTPCCHHELSTQIRGEEFDFILRYPILKQKLCDAATDALRALRLEAEGYTVTALELIDPEETPKNVMLRAVKNDISDDARAVKLSEYVALCRMLHAEPYLARLLGGDTEA